MAPKTVAQDARIALSTAPSGEVARALARELVARRVAACVNVLDGVTSIYRWNGAVEEAGESLLVIKTSAEQLANLEAALLELHPYDTPEFVAWAPGRVEPSYLEWLLAQTR